jgi:hypothetical protein
LLSFTVVVIIILTGGDAEAETAHQRGHQQEIEILFHIHKYFVVSSYYIPFYFGQVKGLLLHTATAKLMIIFDLPREKHAKTTLFVNIETEIADFESRRGKWKVKWVTCIILCYYLQKP